MINICTKISIHIAQVAKNLDAEKAAWNWLTLKAVYLWIFSLNNLVLVNAGI